MINNIIFIQVTNAVLLRLLMYMVLLLCTFEQLKADPLSYKIEENDVTVINCDKNYEGHLTIPISYKGNPVTGIGVEAFKDCRKIKTVLIPESIIDIRNWAFAGCISLSNVTIPNSASIGFEVFANCNSLSYINAGLNHPIYSSDNGVLFNKNRTKIIAYPNSRSSHYNIPNSVKAIGRAAFRSCRIRSIQIPSSVTRIEYSAFLDCKNIRNITLPESIVSIESYTFLNCNSLSSVDIPIGVTRIKDKAFFNTNLTTVFIPNPKCIIDENAFDDWVEIIIGKKQNTPFAISNKLNLPFKISFKSIEKATYELQCSENLKKWSKLQEIKGTGSRVEVSDQRKAIFQQQYYRIKLVD